MSDRLPKNISKTEHPHRDLSTALRFGRDDKGESGASREESSLNGSHFSSAWVGSLRPLAPRPLRRFLATMDAVTPQTKAGTDGNDPNPRAPLSAILQGVSLRVSCPTGSPTGGNSF